MINNFIEALPEKLEVLMILNMEQSSGKNKCFKT